MSDKKQHTRRECKIRKRWIACDIKKEGKNHGMGMKNVKEMIEGKNGLFNFKVQGEEFICTIMLRYNQ